MGKIKQKINCCTQQSLQYWPSTNNIVLSRPRGRETRTKPGSAPPCISPETKPPPLLFRHLCQQAACAQQVPVHNEIGLPSATKTITLAPYELPVNIEFDVWQQPKLFVTVQLFSRQQPKLLVTTTPPSKSPGCVCRSPTEPAALAAAAPRRQAAATRTATLPPHRCSSR